MSKYGIKIEYRTGDSFSNEDRTSYVEGEWENLDIITENLERIEEHYKWYQEMHSGYRRTPKKIEPCIYADPEFDFNIKLLLDNGNEYIYNTFWCGYFETLYSAEVEQVTPSLPKVKF